jgi:hypothetical protein
MSPRCAASEHCGGQRVAEAVHRDHLFDSRRLRVALQFLADPRYAEHAAEAVKEKWKVRRCEGLRSKAPCWLAGRQPYASYVYFL